MFTPFSTIRLKKNYGVCLNSIVVQFSEVFLLLLHDKISLRLSLTRGRLSCVALLLSQSDERNDQFFVFKQL